MASYHYKHIKQRKRKSKMSKMSAVQLNRSERSESSEWYLNGVVPVPDGRTGLARVIKHGSLGEVIEATWNGSPCAIKLFTRKQVLSSTVLKREKRFEYEMKHWVPRLRHPNVVQFLGLWEDKDEDGVSSVGMVMERLHTDLHTFVENNAAHRDSISLEFKRAIMVDVTHGMRYIHSLRIYHLDLTPSNVLLTRSFTAKIADFGIAKGDKEIAMGNATVTSGTNEFMPPEAFPSDRSRQRRDFDYYTDSFSFGCLVLFMLTHMWPEPLVKVISDHDTRKIYRRTEIERRQALLDDLKDAEKEFEPLILACLKEEPPTDRPSFHDIHNQLMKAKPKMAVFTDTNISHQVFSRFALGNSSKAELPTPVASEEREHIQHRQPSVSKHLGLAWVAWVVWVLIGVMAAYFLGGLLRIQSDSST